MTIIIFAFLFLILPSAHAISTTELTQTLDKLDYSGTFSMGGLYVDSTKNKARVLSFALHNEFKYPVAPNLTGLLKGGLSLQTGSSESVFNNDYQPNSGFYLAEGLLNYHPFAEYLQLDFGAINQGRYQNPLLLSGAAFLGSYQQVKLPINNFYMQLETQQSIATNSTHTSRIDNVKEGTPTLFLERASLGFNGKQLNVTTHISYFSFANLSRSVANQSRFYGNTVIGTADNAMFAYDFAGFESGGKIELKLDTITFTIKGNYLFNDKAPDGKNEGFLLHFSARLNLASQIPLTLGFEKFRNEANTSPAYYNANVFGHNNVEGFMILATTEFSASKIALNASYAAIDILNTNLYQANTDKFTFSLAKSF